MPYSQYTRSGFVAELAQALNDPSHVYWAADEMVRALNEALLLWGALTCYWTTSGTFATVAATPFYDLSAQLPTLRARTYTFDHLTKEMQYHLLEPASGTDGTGMTDQFAIGQLTSALARRRNQFALDSRMPLTFSTVAANTPPTSSITLDQSVAAITRAAWIDGPTGIATPLRRSDKFAAQSYNPSWSLSSGRPYAFAQAEAMPMTALIVPPARNAGTLHLTYVATVPLTIAGGTNFAIPDEFAWALKYGALYETLSTNSQGYDPIRTKYCLERYQNAVELAATHRSLIRIRSNNTPLAISTLGELDSGKPFWQSLSGAPQLAACAYDIVAFYRVPSAAYTISCDVAQSAPLPAADGSLLQLGKEELPYIFDYCRHILQLKIGGTELVQSMPLYDNFLKGAIQRSKLIEVKARYLTPLFTRPQEEEQQLPAA